MKIIAQQVHDLIVVPTLPLIGMDSPSARKLMVYTAAVESGFECIKQLGGPAIGFWQMQFNAYDQCRDYLRRPSNDRLQRTILNECNLVGLPVYDTMLWHLKFAMCMARVQYWQVEEPMPGENDLDGMASYWARHYNCGKNPDVERFKNVCEGLLE